MANSNDVLLKSTIHELSQDPDFVNLSPERQDVLINRVMQDKGSIPHHENFLQRVIKGSQNVGNDAYSALYHGADWASGGAVDAARQVDNSMFGRNREAPQSVGSVGKYVLEPAAEAYGAMFGAPGKLAGVAEETAAKGLSKLPWLSKNAGRAVGGAVGGYSIPGTETQREKMAKGGAVLGPLIGTGLDIGGSAVKGLSRFGDVLKGKGIKELQQTIEQTQGNINQATSEANTLGTESSRLGNIKDYIGKRGKRELINQSESGGYKVAKNVKENVSNNFENAKLNYRDMIQNSHPENVNLGDIYDVLDKTVSNKGIGRMIGPDGTQILDSSEKALLGIKGDIEKRIPLLNQEPGVIQEKLPQNLSRIADIKNFKNKVFGALKTRPDLEAEFLNNYADMLDSRGLSEFNDATQGYRAAYKAKIAAKPLTKTAYTRATSGKAPYTVNDLKTSEAGAGVNQLEGMIKKQAQTRTQYASAKSKVGDWQRSLENIKSDTESAGGLMGDRLKMLNDQLKGMKFKQTLARFSVGGAALEAANLLGLKVPFLHSARKAVEASSGG